MARTLNSSGSTNAAARIAAGDVSDAPWSFSADDGNTMLGANGDNWPEYSRWHLAINTGEAENTKAYYSYPFGKIGRIYLAALRAIRSRASAAGDTAIFDRAGVLLDAAKPGESDSGDSGDTGSTSFDNVVHRGYSILQVKAIQEDQRLITGMASTPETDRMGDVVDPLGAQFKNPMPLLWQHNADQPIGRVEFAKPTKRGIEFSAQLPRIPEPGTLRDRVEEAWQSIKYGLVAGASIGFRPLKDGVERLDAGGLAFKSYEILEMSIVTIPANAGATIDVIRSLDRQSLAALGSRRPVRLISPGASGSTTSKSRRSPEMPKSISDQIAALENTRAVKAVRLEEIMHDAAEEGRSTDEAESQEFDTIQLEVEAIDRDLKRLRTVEKMQIASARPVVGAPAAAAGENRPHVVVRSPPKLDQGIGFAQFVKCVAVARGNPMQALEYARDQLGEDSEVTQSLKVFAKMGTTSNLDLIVRTTAAPGATTTDSDWAGPLVFPYPRLASEFIDFLRPRTVLGRIPGMTQIPFNVNIAGQTSGGTAGWVGEGKAKPVTTFGLTSVNFRWAKLAAIIVESEELMRFSSPSADALFRNELAKTIAERQDLDFLDPTNAGTANVKPAAITNGAASRNSSGNSADHVRADLGVLMAGFDDANISAMNPVLIMSVTKARDLALMRTLVGVPEFPNVDLMGNGSVLGLPLVSSQYIARFGTTGGEDVILVNAPDIYFADDGQVTIDASREASLEMATDPGEEESAGTGAAMVSMFQTNSIAIRAERYVNWQRRRTAAVQVLKNVFWGSSSASGT